MREVERVCVVPVRPDADADLRLTLGAYGADGQSIDEVRLSRHQKVCGLAPYQEPSAALEGDAAYGGVLLDEFGHFLIESLSRMWWLRDNPGLPVVWHTVHPGLKRWQSEIFAMLGVTVTEESIVREPLAVKRLKIPEAAQHIGRPFHPRNIEALAIYEFGEPIPGRKVWLSRSKLGPGLGRVIGEVALEMRLERRGWEIVHPQTLSIAEQLEKLSRAEVIAGFQGSAFHLLLLARNVRARIRIVHRGRRWIHSDYWGIAKAKNLDQHACFVPMRLVGGAANRRVYRLVRPRPVIEFIEGTGPAPERMAPLAQHQTELRSR